MPNLQEVISRGRFIFSGAPKRLEVFKLINGARTTREIAIKTGRPYSSVLHDIEKLEDMELVEKKRSEKEIVKRAGASVYKKVPLVKHISMSYFQDSTKTSRLVRKDLNRKTTKSKLTSIRVPSEKEILDICKYGEDQLYEFKGPGTEPDRLTREIAAFLHTKSGGIIFYGVDDDGTIVGSDIKRQGFDQRLQNSIKNTISPAPPIVELKERDVMGHKILIILIPPWDRKNIYQHKGEKYLIRKGTNVFTPQPDELKKLSRGEYVV